MRQPELDRRPHQSHRAIWSTSVVQSDPMSFQRVAELEDLWSGEKIGLLVQGEPVLLVRIDDVVHAYSDRCLHKRAPLSTGTLRGHTLRCSSHEWEYDVVTGECLNPRGQRLARYAVELRDGGIWVDTSGVA